MLPGDVVMVPMTVLACNEDKSLVEGRIRWGEQPHETSIVRVMGMDCHPPSAGQTSGHIADSA